MARQSEPAGCTAPDRCARLEESRVSLRRRDKSSPWPTVTILALALTSPFWIVALASMITTRRQAVSLALALPALAASAVVGSWWFLATHSVDSAGRARARRV